MLDQYSPGTLGLMGSVRVAILNQRDLEEATSIVEELRPPRTEPAASWWWHKRALISLVAAFICITSGFIMVDSERHPFLTLTSAVVGSISFGTTFVLLLRGLQADAAQAKHDSNAEEED